MPAITIIPKPSSPSISVTAKPATPAASVTEKPEDLNFLLLQSGGNLLLESGGRLVLTRRIAGRWSIVAKAT